MGPPFRPSTGGTVRFPEDLVLVLVFTSAAVLLGTMFDPVFHGLGAYVFFYIPVAAITVLAGWRTGVLAAALGIAVGFYAFIYLPGRFHEDAGAHYGLLVLNALIFSVIIALGSWGRRVAQLAAESQERLHVAIGASGLGTYEHDVLTGRVQFSPTLREMYGFAPNETLTVEKVMKRISALDRDNYRSALQAALQGDGHFRFGDFRVEHPGGRIRWLKAYGRVLFEGEGLRRRAVRMLGAVLDITDRREAEEALQEHLQAAIRDVIDRKNAERALRESEQRFRTLADNMSQLAWMADSKGNIFWFNKRWYDYTGTTFEQMGEGRWLNVYHPAHVQRVVNKFTRCVETGETWEDTFPLRSSGGDYRWFLSRAMPIRDDSGRVVQWFGTNTDITEQKDAEDALRRRENALTQAGFMTHLGAWDIEIEDLEHVENNPLRWSEEVYRIFGYKPGSVAVSSAFFLKHVHPADSDRVTESVRQAIAEKSPYRLEHRIIRSDGKEAVVLEQAEIFCDEQDRPVRIIGAIQDITEHKHLEEELKRALEAAHTAKAEAEGANSAKDHFLAVLSHELRTPLAPVVTALALVERREDIPKDVREILEVMHRNVTLQARLIDDLLDLTRIAKGKVSLERKPADLTTLLQRVVEICRPDLEARNLSFKVNIRDAGLTVNCDSARLHQVFWNLLKNSIKFTPDGGCVGIGAWKENDQVHVEVVDSGIGIPPESLQRIFSTFEQADQTVHRTFGGLGLGLAISKKLIEMHEGTISAHSEGQGKGATFHVALPLHHEQKPEAQEEKITRAGSQGKDLNILLVEDHGDTARMLSTLLEVSGYRVATASGVGQALTLARKTKFDVLISDLGLPDGSGLDLMSELRAENREIKAIAVSGYGREEDVQRSKDAGFVSHLTKPVDFDRLVESIQHLG